MRQPTIDKPFLVVAIIIVVIIVYGSLYPFTFQQPSNGIGPVRTLLESWAAQLERGDVLANILLYVPLGFFGSLAIRRRVSLISRACVMVLLGASLSTFMELSQYYDAGRVTSAIDVYSNVIGTLTGTVGALWFGGEFGAKFVQHPILATPPLMLLATWATFRLFPFVPVITLHQVWSALRPIILYPSFAPYALFRHISMWMTVAVLIDRAAGIRRSYLWFAAFAVFLLSAKLFVAGATLSVAETAGAIVAFCWALASRDFPRLRIITACALLTCYVIAFRLEPFDFQALPKHFDWTPFFGFMHGSINVDVLSFLEKYFLYGSMIWLFVEVGFQLRWATLIVASVLFATSWMEVYLPSRSAEITDMIIALLIGCVTALMCRPPSGQNNPSRTAPP
jgi:VanZ family protein